MVTGVKIIFELEEHHIEQLCALYRDEWWTLKREPQKVKRMLKHCDMVVGLVDTRNQLIGFTRVLSDFTYKALLLDVIVSTTWRRRGLGVLLMETVLEAPALKEVSHFELYCMPEMSHFYRRWGFRDEGQTLQFMRLGR